MSQIITPRIAQPTSNSNNNNNNNNNNSNNHRSKVWTYFKQCDDDTTKFRCNLCSAELRNTRGTTTILWNHVKFKHSIERNSTKTVTTSNNNNNNNISKSNIHTSTNNITLTTAPSPRNHISNNELDLNGDKFFSTAARVKSNATPAMVLSNSKDINSNNQKKLKFKQNLDYVNFNDLTDNITSMKPLPSTSLSKNLISRLNQLSLPVTRKLKFWNKKSFQVNQYDPSFKVIYLGNLGMHLWSKDESCLDKPLSTLWNNYLVNMKTEIVMRLTICNSGLKAITRQHGLTQYWSNRLVYCCSHKNYPRIFSWVYRHEGKKMRQELRCHAVFCPSPDKASKMVIMLNQRLACALQEFRREKKSRGISLVNNNISPSSLMQNQIPRTIPLRRQILEKGSANFRPPLERSKSAPKLTSILEEDDLEEESEEDEDATHDEFEYEESFLDKDDDDSDYEHHPDKDEEEDSMNKAESNSMTTTFNEELSNSSICTTTGDSKNSNHITQNQQNDNPSIHQNPSPSVEHINQRSLESSVSHEFSTGTHPSLLQTEEILENNYQKLADKNQIMKNQGHKQINNHDDNDLTSSANIKNNISTSSSSTQNQMATNKEKLDNCSIGEEEFKAMTINKAKNNNTSNHKSQQKPTTDDHIDAGINDDSTTTTQEIILSWSNLVIK